MGKLGRLSFSEVVAQLERDKCLEFESLRNFYGREERGIIAKVEEGRLTIVYKDNKEKAYINDVINLKRAWRLIDKRISFNEAMEALKNGQDVYCDYKGERLFYRAASMYPFSTVTAGGGRYLVVGAMLEGDWYLGGLY